MLKRYYISNAVTYRELAKLDFTTHHVDMAEISDPIIMPLLSPNGLDILCDGAQYSRTEKTARIVDLALAQKYLNVCVNSSNKHVEAKNCSRCSKCLRTMMALESAGALQKFSGVFDLKQWKRRSFKYKCKQVFLYKSDSFAQDNVDFARKQGERLPDKLTAAVVVSCLRLIALPRNFFRKLKKKGHG